MREFIAAGAGRTLGEAVEHWRATRTGPPRAIGPQFELNRFSRDWHRSHPEGTPKERQEAWAQHRSLPADNRPAP